MLGRLAEDGRPVALIPDASRGYVLVDPARGAGSPVDGGGRPTLQPTAVVVLPDPPRRRAGASATSSASPCP